MSIANGRTEYWHWGDETTTGKMYLTRDEQGRFKDFHFYEPLVIEGERV